MVDVGFSVVLTTTELPYDGTFVRVGRYAVPILINLENVVFSVAKGRTQRSEQDSW